MFAKNERGNRLNEIKKRFWSLLIRCVYKEKIVKNDSHRRTQRPYKFYNYLRMRRKKSMTIVCNIWMICLELNWFVHDPSWRLHLSEFVWTLRSSVAKKQIKDCLDKFNQFSRLGRLSSEATPWPLISPYKFIFTFL